MRYIIIKHKQYSIKDEMPQSHPDIVTLVLGELSGHGQAGDGHGGGVGCEVGAHGEGRGAGGEGGGEEEEGEQRYVQHSEETTGD